MLWRLGVKESTEVTANEQKQFGTNKAYQLPSGSLRY